MKTPNRRFIAGLAALLMLPVAHPASLDLTTASVAELNAAFDAGALTSEKLVRLYLKRIEAYDDKGPAINAVLALNRRMSSYRFVPRVSIMTRNDGIYESADLRAACEQALAYQRYIDSSYGTKKCAGVRFVFLRSWTSRQSCA